MPVTRIFFFLFFRLCFQKCPHLESLKLSLVCLRIKAVFYGKASRPEIAIFEVFSEEEREKIHSLSFQSETLVDSLTAGSILDTTEFAV